jgi:hypothetical protein
MIVYGFCADGQARDNLFRTVAACQHPHYLQFTSSKQVRPSLDLSLNCASFAVMLIDFYALPNALQQRLGHARFLNEIERRPGQLASRTGCPRER